MLQVLEVGFLCEWRAQGNVIVLYVKTNFCYTGHFDYDSAKDWLSGKAESRSTKANLHRYSERINLLKDIISKNIDKLKHIHEDYTTVANKYKYPLKQQEKPASFSVKYFLEEQGVI